MCFNVFLPPGVVVNVVSPGSLWFVFLHLLQNNVGFFSQLHAAVYLYGAGVLLRLCALRMYASLPLLLRQSLLVLTEHMLCHPVAL